MLAFWILSGYLNQLSVQTCNGAKNLGLTFPPAVWTFLSMIKLNILCPASYPNDDNLFSRSVTLSTLLWL